MRLFVVSTPDTSEKFTPVYMEYRIGTGFHLYRTECVFSTKGGMMGIDCTKCSENGSIQKLLNEILKECAIHSFCGILLEISENPSPLVISFARSLDQTAHSHGLLLFARESAASCTEYAKILIGTAISGGTFAGYLRNFISSFGIQRIALDIERTKMDFTLPTKNGNGTELTNQQFEMLYKQRISSFFSNELCAYYFTYRQNNRQHFVLYDTAQSIKKKISVAGQMGINYGFLYYPEICDVLNDII